MMGLSVQLNPNLIIHNLGISQNVISQQLEPNPTTTIDEMTEVKECIEQQIGLTYGQIKPIKSEADALKIISDPSNECCLVSINEPFRMQFNQIGLTSQIDINAGQVAILDGIHDNLSLEFSNYEQVYLLFNTDPKKSAIKIKIKIKMKEKGINDRIVNPMDQG